MADPRRQALAVAGFALGAVALGGQLRLVWGPDAASNDYTRDYVAARAWIDGDDPYGEQGPLVDRYLGRETFRIDVEGVSERVPHPPAHLVLWSPLGFLRYRPARAILIVLSAASIVIGVALVARRIGFARAEAWALGAGSLALPVAQKELFQGQVNAIVLLFVVLAWAALARGREAAAGVALGLAAAVRLFPLVLVLPLVLTKRARAAASMTLSFALVTVGSALALGTGSIEGFTDASRENFELWRSALNNISLPGIAYRWLTANRFNPGAVDRPAVAAAVAGIAIAACLVAIAVSVRRSALDPLWAAVPWALLASPLTSEQYFVLAFPVLLMLARRGMSLLVAVAAAATVIGAPTRSYGGIEVASHLAWSVPTLALALLGWAVLRAREAPAAAP